MNDLELELLVCDVLVYELHPNLEHDSTRFNKQRISI